MTTMSHDPLQELASYLAHDLHRTFRIGYHAIFTTQQGLEEGLRKIIAEQGIVIQFVEEDVEAHKPADYALIEQRLLHDAKVDKDTATFEQLYGRNRQ